jgi:Na+/proline symporter
MGNLNTLDYSIIVVYFTILIGIGFYLKKRASASLEDYFLGGRQIPWWALGISGMAAWLDVTGTMIISSFLFMLGPRGLFVEFRGGAVLILPIILLWTGKWHRRSGCITGAEWMVYRFGEGFGGQFARIVSSTAAFAATIGMLAYMVKGVGMFLSMFLPFSPVVCSMILISIATAYTLASGFYGVVFTDVFQSGIVLCSVIGIVVMAIVKSHGADLAVVAEQVTGNSQWLSAIPQWKTSMPEGYKMYEDLLMFSGFYLLKNIFAGMGMGDEPIYFGARNDRECGLLSFLRGATTMFRWPFMLAFAILGLFMVNDFFADQSQLVDASDLIHGHFVTIAEKDWITAISSIINQSADYPELVKQLKTVLGDAWVSKLNLVSYHGTVNPERILPAVILFDVPMGFRGLILISLIAASMSTFDTTINRALGFFTRDIYQRYLRPTASSKELIRISWVFGLILIVLGFLLSYTVKNINDIWGWIIMGLMGGLAVPTFLRFYWWRFNGEGFALGMIFGLVTAFFQRLYWPDLHELGQFILVLCTGGLGCVAGTYLCKSTPRKVLDHFYKTSRPFGLWAPMKNALAPKVRIKMEEEHKNDLIALPFTYGWQISLFLWPMLLLVGNWKGFWTTFMIFCISIVGMYIFWYRKLPKENISCHT